MGATVHAVVTAGGAVTARRRLFVVEALDAADVFLRVLGIVAVQQARLSGATLDGREGRVVARLEIEGLNDERADYLRRRLAQLHLVTAVSMGWRS